jgi:hypothetical protein
LGGEAAPGLRVDDFLQEKSAMMDKENLRKADGFTGAAIVLFGAWVISRAVRMPMKDSWGGVQNVWFVSPALFPLFVGGMIVLLGLILIRTALKEAGRDGFSSALAWVFSAGFAGYLASEATLRFYALVLLLVSFVYLYIPAVDFFVCTVQFLTVFIMMFLFDRPVLLKKLFVFHLLGTLGFLLFRVFAGKGAGAVGTAAAADVLVLCLLLAFAVYAWLLVRRDPELRKKYRTSLAIALITPFVLGPVFKYFLLVPLPAEGLVVMLLDALWYR